MISKDSAPKNHEAHISHVYHDERYLLGALHEFIKIGIEQNEGVVIIATAGHIEALKSQLSLFKPFQVIFIDASTTLKIIMTNDFLNKNKFKELIVAALSELRVRYDNIRFFSESIDVLRSRKMPEQATELIGYWNELLNIESGISLMSSHYSKTPVAHEVKNENLLHEKIAALEMRLAHHKRKEVASVKVEREVVELKKHLTHASKLSLLGEITANLAHEIMNPLTIVHSYTSVLKSVLKDENFAGRDFSLKQADGIDNTVGRMSDLMKNILLLSSSNVPQHAVYSISESIESSIEMMNGHLRSKNITLIHNPSSSDFYGHGDSGQMIQIMLNMITNSRDAIEEAHGIRGGTISITEKIKADNSLEILIEDNGIGMKKVVQDNIFKTFFTTKKPGKGTGLGLSIVQKIVKDFKGSISCTSMIHQGTHFSIILPGKSKTVRPFQPDTQI